MPGFPELHFVKTQNWNMVHVPYCTGDVYGGDKVATYADPARQGAPIIWHHNGLRNTRAVIAWLRDHLPRPTQMLSTGLQRRRDRQPHELRPRPPRSGADARVRHQRLRARILSACRLGPAAVPVHPSAHDDSRSLGPGLRADRVSER